MAYRYTALGDSLTVGTGALPGSGFVPLYRSMAQRALQERIILHNYGVNGLTSGELLSQLNSSTLLESGVSQASFITVSIGGNDLLRMARSGMQRDAGGDLELTKRNVRRIVNTLLQIKRGSREPFFIRILGLYNPLPRYPQAQHWVGQYNRFLSTMNAGVIRAVQIQDSFAGQERRLLSLDGIHPNGRGYRVIAAQLNQAGYYPLR